MTPLTPILAYARTRGELQALGVDVSLDSSLEEITTRIQARITQVATGKAEYFDRELLDDLMRHWRTVSSAARPDLSLSR